jgi:hypothetical protein
MHGFEFVDVESSDGMSAKIIFRYKRHSNTDKEDSHFHLPRKCLVGIYH